MNRSETLHCIAVVKRKEEKTAIHFTNADKKQVSIEVPPEEAEFFETGKDYQVDSTIVALAPAMHFESPATASSGGEDSE